MGLKEYLGEILGRKPVELDVAGHIADRISALEQNRSIALRSGDPDLAQDCTAQIRNLREEAAANNLSRDDYPGLYR